ncbi:hypothetical protein BK670_26930 [Pseudomonas fluorescens]|uniref:Uncharacterized protein n=1 Tax=Pseudomonas fluorescens TaxID=294 RepID=A0A423M5N3_PSEFL|nr:hypothetical protein BK670_26930 [Pseudomonas fluorescens]
MFTAGFTFVRTFRIDRSFHADNLDSLQAGPSKPDPGNSAGCQTNTDVIAVIGDPFPISLAESFFRLAHDFPGRFGNDDIDLIGLRFDQRLPAHIDQSG